MDLAHIKNSELEQKFQKYKGRVRCIHRAGFIRVANDGRRYSVRFCQTTQMRCTSKRRSISKHRQNGTLLELPKSERPDTWIPLPRHKWPQAWHSIEEPVVLVERHLCGHSPCWVAVRETVWKNSSSGKWMGESTTLEMLVLASAARSIPVRVRG